MSKPQFFKSDQHMNFCSFRCLLQAQMKSLPHVAIADGCRLLTLLCAGPRSHLRKVVDAKALALATAPSSEGGCTIWAEHDLSSNLEV